MLLFATKLSFNQQKNVDAIGFAVSSTPLFRYPVVQNSITSAYFDHYQVYTTSGEDYDIRLYDGRNSLSLPHGYIFTCSGIGDGLAWIGCTGANYGSEVACPNSSELWYDNHKGIDFEYATNWHTGSSCNLAQFSGITKPIYAPASGYVSEVGNNAANRNFLMILHDVNKNNNYYDDGIRSVYLHFYSISVSQNSVVEEGQFLGYGGMTGLAWTLHLHFEVQKSSNGFSSVYSVDPLVGMDLIRIHGHI